MMSQKKIIVHFINTDSKFTAGYINFMKLKMNEYDHHFFVYSASYTPLKLCDDFNVYYYPYDKPEEIFSNPSSVKLLQDCNKIIASGIFFSGELKKALLSQNLIAKTYLHFWGGDFYYYRDMHYSLRHLRGSLYRFKWKRLQHLLVKKCAGTINLIEGDIEKLCAIFPNKVKHFVAPMMGDPSAKIDYAAIRAKIPSKNICKIIVGNSATETNHHIEAFHFLEHLKNENLEIICPLSYGGEIYRDKVIEEGRKIFGGKFIPIVDFMDRKEYVNFLASCDVGIFNNDRQQGMGNISILLRLGKKIYMRENVSMYKHYKALKYFIYDIAEIKSSTLEQLLNFPAEQAYNNIQIGDELQNGNLAVEQWRKVFDD